MKQIILLNTGVSASKQTLAQFIALAGRAWITNKIRENSVQSTACDCERLPVYKTIPAWANKGVERKKPICYRHNDLYNIAERVREQGGAYFYVKRIDKLGYGTQYTEVPAEKVKWQRDIKFSLDQDTFEQYTDRTLAPSIYKVQGHFQMKEIMSERVMRDMTYEEDWIDFWYNDERITVGFRPLADEVANEITKGLELL